jgi:superfamily II DNA or RNA helicase
LENEEAIKVPRYFPVENFIDSKVVDVRSEGQDIDITHNIRLRDDLQKNVVNYMLNHTNGIIQSPPGSGKTVMAIFVISELRKKTIILVHRDSLAEQWTERFLEYTNISPDEIGRLSSANFKDCLNKSIIISTNQTFISLLKRNRDEFLQKLKDSNIGILLSDEAHTSTGAPTFSECSLHIPAYRTYGLSATPARQDGTTDVIEYHLGNVWVPEGLSSTMSGNVTVILFNSGMLPKSRGYIYWGGMFQRSRYLSMLSKSPIMLKISEALINKFYNEDRNILYVSDRIKLIETLYNTVKCESKSKFIASAKNEMLNYKLCFATVGKIRDGVDIPAKDCLIIPSPVGNIEQLAGRILRIKEGKKQPIIVDMVDLCFREISGTFHGRLKFYKSKNWEVKYIIISSDGKKQQLNESEVMNLMKGKE